MKLPLLLLLALLATVPLLGQSLLVIPKSTHPPEMDVLHYLELRYAGETYTMVPSSFWRMQVDAQAALLKFSSRTGTVAMTIQFMTNDARGILASTDSLRQFAMPQLSEATVLDAFPAFCGNMAGKGVDLGYSLYGRAVRSRAAVVPISGGCVQFLLTCGVDEFKEAQQNFGGMLTSLQRISTAPDNGLARAK